MWHLFGELYEFGSNISDLISGKQIVFTKSVNRRTGLRLSTKVIIRLPTCLFCYCTETVSVKLSLVTWVRAYGIWQGCSNRTSTDGALDLGSPVSPTT